MSLSSPKILIVVRAGRNSLHRSWSYLRRERVDVAVSTYEDADWAGPDADFLHHAPGGKFLGIKHFLAENPGLIDQYDYMWAFEDDLLLPYSSLVTVQALLARFRFFLAAPSLSAESFFGWPLTVQNETMLWRGTDFVEIMAPIMSRDFLKLALPYFDENFSSWGYEWLWRRFLNETGSFAAILDAAPIVHTRPPGCSTLYDAGSRSVAIQEMNDLISKFKLTKEPFRNLFGITNEQTPRLLTANNLLHRMIGGYRGLMDHNFDNYGRCIDGLLNHHRPIAAIDQLRCLNGFAEVENFTSAGRPFSTSKAD
nr:hypothetical protein [uncultured Rhodopila sp.]